VLTCKCKHIWPRCEQGPTPISYPELPCFYNPHQHTPVVTSQQLHCPFAHLFAVLVLCSVPVIHTPMATPTLSIMPVGLTRLGVTAAAVGCLGLPAVVLAAAV
jgi:hypothetical protein